MKIRELLEHSRYKIPWANFMDVVNIDHKKYIFRGIYDKDGIRVGYLIQGEPVWFFDYTPTYRVKAILV